MENSMNEIMEKWNSRVEKPKTIYEQVIDISTGDLSSDDDFGDAGLIPVDKVLQFTADLNEGIKEAREKAKDDSLVRIEIFLTSNSIDISIGFMREETEEETRLIESHKKFLEQFEIEREKQERYERYLELKREFGE